MEDLIERIQRHLSFDLLSPTWKKMTTGHPLSGHCYVASEVLWHMVGARNGPWFPWVGRGHEGTHWWLQNYSGVIADPTAHQFLDLGILPPYKNGKRCSFLTEKPSRRARILMDRMGVKWTGQ